MSSLSLDSPLVAIPLFVALGFLIVGSPVVYNFTDSKIAPLLRLDFVSPGGKPTRAGLIVHATVLAVLVYAYLRAFSPEVYQRAKDAILAHNGDGEIRSQSGHPCRVTITVDHETVPWPTNPATEKLLAHWQETGRSLGLQVARQERGGLSDGNVLWNYFPTLDGLGPRGDQSHCSEHSADGSKVQEWVDTTSFVPKAVLNATALIRLLARMARS